MLWDEIDDTTIQQQLLLNYLETCFPDINMDKALANIYMALDLKLISSKDIILDSTLHIIKINKMKKSNNTLIYDFDKFAKRTKRRYVSYP
jgi:hypothetical protein